MLMLETIHEVLLFVTALNIMAIILILFRKDRGLIFRDLRNMFRLKSFSYVFINLISSFFFLLPFSIPFSIMYLMDGSDD